MAERRDHIAQALMTQAIMAQAAQPIPTAAEMARARAEMANRMSAASDPSEGDYLAAERYNTARAAEGIRLYQGDRPYPYR
jgi:hypothetical protein